MAPKNAPPEKHVVVDGSNIATEGRSLPSLAQLDEAVRAFIDEHPHDRVTVVVDATFGHRIDASEKDAFEEAVLAGELVSPPAGAIGRGDAFVLQIADKANATILSNDSFQEFHGQYEWLFDEGRLIGGKPVQGVGWIFMLRTPVRGPTSRRATRGAKKREPRSPAASKRAGTTAPPTKASESGPSPARKRGSRRAKAEPSIDPSQPMPTPTKPPPSRATPSPPASDERGGGRRKRRSGGSGKPAEPINEPLPFIEFIADHPIGSTVTGTVESFSSHGAYVVVNAARCYIPLKAMADPAPTRARDVLTIGEEREFVVVAIDTPRRGIDVALPGFAEIQEAQEPHETEPSTAGEAAEGIMSTAEAPAEARRARTAATRQSGATTQADSELTAEEVPEVAQAKKATKKKSAAKKASARKSTAKKATTAARKSTAKKAPARKAAAKKTAAKRAPAKKTAAKKTAAKKSTAKKSTAKKTAAKKSTAKKSAAKKSTARKTTAKKAAKKR